MGVAVSEAEGTATAVSNKKLRKIEYVLFDATLSMSWLGSLGLRAAQHHNLDNSVQRGLSL
jgi:hypothetical protein